MTERQLKAKIAGMSTEEKLLELTQYNFSDMLPSGTEGLSTGVASLGYVTPEQLLRLGTVLNSNGAEDVIRIRKKRKEEGIEEPLLVMHDVIHGYRTIYPVPLALACSFDLKLTEDCAEMAAIEARYDGIDATFSPMADLVRDARWGRVMESAGEDPFLAGEMGKAFIRGYRKGGIACCVKHCFAYGAAEAGREYNTTDVSLHSLNEYYLRAYRACMAEQPDMVMSSFNLLNGIPVLGHRNLTVDALRTEWGFDGVLISDYAAVSGMIDQGYCEDYAACAKVSVDSELDIEMCSSTYLNALPELVRVGKVRSEQIDRAVFRVLSLKNKLGLYENPDRYTDLVKRDEVTLSAAHRALARRAAEKSAVLLKNNGVLPLNEKNSVALVGPFAAEKEIYGNWGCRGRAEETVSVQEGIEKLLGRKTGMAAGCKHGLFETDESGIAEAVACAGNAEVVVACIGESMWNSGEAHSRTNLFLSVAQKALVRALKATGKPLVLVVFGGRPLAVAEEAALADAVLYVWQPGTEGGNAIADLLYGKANPSGKTVMSFPRSAGQCPIYYNCFGTCRPNDDYVIGAAYGSGYDDEVNAPLYPFGYGLSYTEFVYSDLKLSRTQMKRNGMITASVWVKNAGARAGEETVQWYLHDRFASCARPVKELKGFEKIMLEAGEEKEVFFEISEETLAFYTASGEFAAETGSFELFVGGNSRDCLKTEFSLI